MKSVKAVFAAVFFSSVLMAPSAAFAQQNLQQCLDQADSEYLREMDRCSTTGRNQYNVWNDRVDNDYCEYGAGITHDASLRDCYASYPEEVSVLEAIFGRNSRESHAKA